MTPRPHRDALLVAGALCLGLTLLGAILGYSAIRVREFERSVEVKGLSERDYPADLAIWPISFTVADNDVNVVYDRLEDSTRRLTAFLLDAGFQAGEISARAPSVTDAFATLYGDDDARLRYHGTGTVSIHTTQVDKVAPAMRKLGELGRDGPVQAGGEFRSARYLFTSLNAVKPAMVEEATRNARKVAEKFAADSRSHLGRIRNARQGQFSIRDRDGINPQIKTVRVVSTIEYYLSD